MIKKEIAFFSSHLGLGGIEKSAISYVNNIDKNKYNVTLFVLRCEGENKDLIDKNVKVIEFGECKNKSIIFRKIINLKKIITFYFKYHHKFAFSAHFATSLKCSAILSKTFSRNNAIWFHGNYWEKESDAQKYLKYARAKKYQKVVFVSNALKEKYLKVYPNTKQKLYVINNPLDIKEINSKMKEVIQYDKKKPILLNVGRHEEKDKNILMLLSCVKKLVSIGYDFELWLVGSGKDTPLYKAKVKELNLLDVVHFFGPQANVFPYYKMCDAFVLSSRREGNPVVFLETKIMQKPIITTNVSDAKKDLDGFGIIAENNEEDYLKALKDFLDKGYQINQKFDIQKYNEDVLKKLYMVIEE